MKNPKGRSSKNIGNKKDFKRKEKESYLAGKKNQTKERLKGYFDKAFNNKAKSANASAKLKRKHNRNEKNKPFNLVLYKGGRTLVVGDGDLTFSVSLTQHINNYTVIATTYDTKEQIISKYGQVASNSLNTLSDKKISVFHGVDATNLSNHFPDVLKQKPSRIRLEKLIAKGDVGGFECFKNYPFDRVIFNFPHTGEQRVHINRDLLKNFFISCRPHLAPYDKDVEGKNLVKSGGRVIVVLKKGQPYDGWNIEEQAATALFELESTQNFDFSQFPGYGHQTTKPEHNELEDEAAVQYVFRLSLVGSLMRDKESQHIREEAKSSNEAIARRLEALHNKLKSNAVINNERKDADVTDIKDKLSSLNVEKSKKKKSTKKKDNSSSLIGGDGDITSLLSSFNPDSLNDFVDE